jgi:hypothetical protein
MAARRCWLQYGRWLAAPCPPWTLAAGLAAASAGAPSAVSSSAARPAAVTSCRGLDSCLQKAVVIVGRRIRGCRPIVQGKDLPVPAEAKQRGLYLEGSVAFTTVD